MKLFRNDVAERLFAGESVRQLPADIQRRARMRAQRVLAAMALTDLLVPPSHRLESLRGDREGQFSIRINDQWRVCFIWTDEGAMEIEVTDYH
ncbi:MAG: type II toxin-antitoxin system RelE/ParE family toxin [Chloroflexota bacterium]|nr:type II toxin-antitoxin system RelE/ParE family toxin [Chloroflexota bacterium]MDE2941971.1 type II toxin-antitoxin system RelE/ParE family toxin [Chloroflexota bacterium]MDE3267069.1 type II toxin-antitoxin system RelE/ParE family toxin [Chloroflexota bacterium]